MAVLLPTIHITQSLICPLQDSKRGKYIPEALTHQTGPGASVQESLQPTLVKEMKPHIGFAGSADSGAERSREPRKCHPVVSLGLPVSAGKCSVLLWRDVRHLYLSWLGSEGSLKKFITFLIEA